MVARQDLTGASVPELMVYNELRRRRLEPGVDFIYQYNIFGGRTQRGGGVLDFFFTSIAYPGLAINVQGEYFHYERGSDVIARDRLLREQLVGIGITLVLIDEEDILSNVRWVVGQALQFRDVSRLG